MGILGVPELEGGLGGKPVISWNQEAPLPPAAPVPVEKPAPAPTPVVVEEAMMDRMSP